MKIDKFIKYISRVWKRERELIELAKRGYLLILLSHFLNFFKDFMVFRYSLRNLLKNYLVEIECLYTIVVDNEYDSLSKYIPLPNQLIVDCGANVGFYSIWAAKNMKRKGKIIALEPLNYNYNRLLFNIKVSRMCNIVFPTRIALSNSEGKAKMIRPEVGTGSTLSIEHLKWLENKYGKDAAEVYWEEEVPTATLDTIVAELNLSKIDILKIDVEGSEIKVLKGARKALTITEKIVIEVHNILFLEEIKEILSSNGFGIEGVFELGRWRDVLLFARRDG